MDDFFQHLFSSDFMPHGHCYLWTPSILWLHVLSDAAIACSYYSIPIALFTFIRKRKDLVFSWIFILFAIFIFACGTTHILEIWTVWHGTYRLSGFIKLITAISSVLTAILLWGLIPKLLALPSPKHLEKINATLLAESTDRKLLQDKLASLNADLQNRMQDATIQLQMALAQKEESLVREREVREEAEKANRLKDEFLSTLSHELRTPLNNISNWIEVLSETIPAHEKHSEVFPVLKRNVTKFSAIIDDLLDMSMILTGSMVLNYKSYDLAEITDEVIKVLLSTAESKRINIARDFPTKLPLLKGDVIRIRQIIWNLLTNAIKFTPTSKDIYVEIKAYDSVICLKILDHGKGIDPNFLPYVFDRFRQESTSSTREYTGLGLGLSIARQLAELHGGSITAQSDGLGKGSTFTLTLPAPV